MEIIEYIEDALKKITEMAVWDSSLIDWKDHTILCSLETAIQKEGSLTHRQGKLLLKILSKYQSLPNLGFNLEEIILNPKWKTNFRIRDTSKSIRVDIDSEGTIWVIIKFPYELVKDFESILINDNNRNSTKWCPESKVRMLKFYDFNMVVLNEFVRQHNFNIDDSFLEVLSKVEEIWQQQENIVPHSKIDNGSVVLVNAISDAVNYFETRRSGNIEKDLFLAKTMGFPVVLSRHSETVIEKISQDSNSHFWFKTNKEFLSLYKTVNDVAAIILDRNTENIIDWLDNFINDAKSMNIDVSKFRVCHREPKDSRIPLNDWIRENNLGGKIEGGQLFIFKQKPAKWLFNNSLDVKIIATNSYTPVNEMSTLWWMQSHPCVCYISDIKPTKTRNKQIAYL